MTGEQQPETKEGQPLQATATAPQPEAKAPDETVNWEGLQAAIKAEADKVHSTLRKESAEKDKWIRLAKSELGKHQESVDKLQSDYDALISKGEGGADVAKMRKELQDEKAAIRKEREFFALEKAQLEEDAKELHSTKLNDLIEDLCTAKESDPELRNRLIANVKKLNPKTKEDVEEYVGMLNVKPPVKTQEASSMAAAGATISDEAFMKGYAELKYNSPADHARARQIMEKRKHGG